MFKKTEKNFYIMKKTVLPSLLDNKFLRKLKPREHP